MLKKIIYHISTFFSVAVLLFLIAAFALIMYFNAPNLYHDSDKKFIIDNGMTFRQVVDKLHKEKIVRNKTMFLYTSQLMKGYNPKVRYGEYFFEKNLSYYKIMHKINHGYVSFRKITIAEGLSTNSALKIIDSSYGLIGGIPQEPILEGELLPETYFYSYNDTKAATLKRMRDAMRKTIDELWEKRDPTIPLNTKEEAITLASIVEKETSVPSERQQIASVFINRIKMHMKLQSDPTIIYSFTKGDKSLERPITKKDILNKSAYNTYNIYGLPPSPICNPGIESIKAVLNPPETKYLYFVASGKTGHKFSTNLKEHNYYVSQYREYIKLKAAEKEKATQGEKTTQEPKPANAPEATKLPDESKSTDSQLY